MITYIGIDVSSDTLHIAYEKDNQWHSQTLINEMIEIDKWISQIDFDIHVVFEHTGTYSNRLAYCLSISEKLFSIITPSQSKGFADTLKKQAKTDKQDAKTLSLFGKKMQPESTILMDENLHQKRQIHRHYNSLQAQKQAISNQLHALSFDPRASQKVITSLENLLDFYQIQLDDFREQLFDVKPDDFEAIKQQLMQIKGIGPVVATQLIITTNGFQNFSSSKALAKFVGLAPSVKQSGKSVNGRGKIAHTSVALLRAKLYVAARSAARFNHACKDLFTRLRAKGKPYKVALISVAHKLLRQAFAIVKNQTVFDNNYQLAK